MTSKVKQSGIENKHRIIIPSPLGRGLLSQSATLSRPKSCGSVALLDGSFPACGRVACNHYRRGGPLCLSLPLPRLALSPCPRCATHGESAERHLVHQNRISSCVALSFQAPARRQKQGYLSVDDRSFDRTKHGTPWMGEKKCRLLAPHQSQRGRLCSLHYLVDCAAYPGVGASWRMKSHPAFVCGPLQGARQ